MATCLNYIKLTRETSSKHKVWQLRRHWRHILILRQKLCIAWSPSPDIPPPPLTPSQCVFGLWGREQTKPHLCPLPHLCSLLMWQPQPRHRISDMESVCIITQRLMGSIWTMNSKAHRNRCHQCTLQLPNMCVQKLTLAVNHKTEICYLTATTECIAINCSHNRFPGWNLG